MRPTAQRGKFKLTCTSGLVSLLILVLTKPVATTPAALSGVPWIAQLHDAKTGVPYGAAMAPAALIVLPQTAWFAHAAM